MLRKKDKKVCIVFQKEQQEVVQIKHMLSKLEQYPLYLEFHLLEIL